ncbi:MAG TPA: Maf family protein [Caulobacteraceae bacterium]|nr:Maf family protein [Caulobacteraceae bacterium]
MTAVVLASQSPSRAAILAAAGVGFETVASDVDEDAEKAALLARGATAREVAARLAESKALRVSSRRPHALVIGADQTLELDGALHDKAASLDEARRRLQALRGRRHALHAAVAIARGGTLIWAMMESPSLLMRDFSDGFLDAYLAQEGEALLGSVGCYRLESRGAQLFEAVDGDYFAILGLPLVPLLGLLRREGALAA